MKSRIALAVLLGCAAVAASAQSPSSAFPRGNSLQAWQDPGLPAVLARCENPPQPFAIGGGPPADAAPPPEPPPAVATAIPGVIAGGQAWKVVWSWEGNNVDGIMAGDNGTMLFANNDASNVMKLDPATGLATVIHSDTNTGGALSRSKNGALFLASRGLHSGILQLEPERKVLASSFRGGPLECVGGVLNDLAADSRGGVYLTISGAGLFYANPQGVVVVAFDVQPDGALTNQREFGMLQGGSGGDGSAVDTEGRLYVSTGSSVDVFAPGGKFLGTIPGPQGLHGTTFGGPDRKTLFGIVFSGGWGTPSARNRVIAIPTIAQGYAGRAK